MNFISSFAICTISFQENLYNDLHENLLNQYSSSDLFFSLLHKQFSTANEILDIGQNLSLSEEKEYVTMTFLPFYFGTTPSFSFSQYRTEGRRRNLFDDDICLIVFFCFLDFCLLFFCRTNIFNDD